MCPRAAAQDPRRAGGRGRRGRARAGAPYLGHYLRPYLGPYLGPYLSILAARVQVQLLEAEGARDAADGEVGRLQRQAKADGHVIEELSGALTLRDVRLGDLEAEARALREDTARLKVGVRPYLRLSRPLSRPYVGPYL